MGLVLAFQTTPRPASSRQPQRRQADRPESADILFFTGARYERRSDDGSTQGSGPAPGGVPTSS
jgi:hypothetical protein